MHADISAAKETIMLRHSLATLALFASLGLATAPVRAQATDPANTLILETKDGPVTIRLRPDLAPKHVEQIKTLTKRGFYDGIVFHRVIDGFMAQTGDPTGTGTGSSDLPNIKAEFTPTPYKVGSVGMARSQSPDSANSQFFICYEGCGSLTGQYTLFGEVVSGMEAVRKIKKGAAGSGMVTGPDKIVRMRLQSDVK
ncbi:MAG TPA: peptidylprolyl isomerase [Bosea sp. (in: a-proteobacteria)]|uniref:peptidylprolyl isomerase n=2 Tax=Bosea TaxID=85413 RepID=UPI002DDD38BF|nr:peptidylprolyl isomerase [Bosea sp. (in: a-proteobacteria)]HEV2556223.1 peptidylprolyl isomerase [Bosea sp. (in: a-proteobacteria)]